MAEHMRLYPREVAREAKLEVGVVEVDVDIVESSGWHEADY